MARYLHTMVRVTDPERSREFYEALGFRFSREMDIVRDGELGGDELLLLDPRLSRPQPVVPPRGTVEQRPGRRRLLDRTNQTTLGTPRKRTRILVVLPLGWLSWRHR